jgi:hypothetical protein
MAVKLESRLKNAVEHADAVMAGSSRFSITLRVGRLGIIVDVEDANSHFAIDRVVTWLTIRDSEVNAIVAAIDDLITKFPKPS